ncbi:MAG: hypothetical protein JRJ54_05795 [Deltaproteobacteria bacterium]|nr:hypothetical protein [Deltaproteobacteria bacterium]
MKRIRGIKWTAVFLAVLFLFAGMGLPVATEAANTAYYKTARTGGGADALDCFVFDGAESYFYQLDADSGASESDPDVISPDVNAGNKRWILQEVHPPSDLGKSIFDYQRPNFEWIDADTIRIGPGGYYLYGKGWCFWTSYLTFDLGSAGSNPNSDNLTASEWHNIAIDYSTVSEAGELTAANFINRSDTNVTPAYSPSKGGVYQDTDDRTIFGVLTNGSSQLLEFFHDGGEQVNPADHIQEHSGGWPNSWSDLTVSAPAFCTKVLLNAYGSSSAGSSFLYFRVNGQTGTTGIQVMRTGASMENTVLVFTDSSQIVEYKEAADSSAGGSIYMNGWFFPAGM